jgi:hypothetical protein
LVPTDLEILAIDLVRRFYQAKGDDWKIGLNGQLKAAGTSLEPELFLALARDERENAFHLLAVSPEKCAVEWQRLLRTSGDPLPLAIPAKKITHSDAMSIRVGAKRRWPAFMLA